MAGELNELKMIKRYCEERIAANLELMKTIDWAIEQSIKRTEVEAQLAQLNKWLIDYLERSSRNQDPINRPQVEELVSPTILPLGLEAFAGLDVGPDSDFGKYIRKIYGI
jgi:hypothetical protein